MADVLIVYATNHGQTAKIGSRLANGVRAAGGDPQLVDIRKEPGVDPAGHGAVIVGGSIHAGHHQRELVDWAKRHAEALSTIPSAFFSVCLTAAEDTEESRAATRKYLDDFCDETGWTPGETATFAGALQYREYDVFTRHLMRLLMRRGGHPTDTSRDFEYTDWDAVERFGRTVTEMAAARPGG